MPTGNVKGGYMNISLLTTDTMRSVLFSQAQSGKTTAQCYPPYGGGLSHHVMHPGYNGERVDPLTGVIHLGNGYRAFNPGLQRFNAPDNLSPFNQGGLNAYIYCDGDPINRADPSGKTTAKAIAGIVLSSIGVILAVAGGALAIGAAKGIETVAVAARTTAAAAMPGLAGVATGVASLTVDDPETADKLSSASLGLGFASLASGLGMAHLREGITKRQINSGQATAGHHGHHNAVSFERERSVSVDSGPYDDVSPVPLPSYNELYPESPPVYEQAISMPTPSDHGIPPPSYDEATSSNQLMGSGNSRGEPSGQLDWNAVLTLMLI